MNRDFYIGLGGHSVSILFNDLDQNQLLTAFNFMKKVIFKNKNNRTYIEVLFDTIRTNMQVYHDKLFLYFLSINNDVDFFKTIDWVGNPGVQTGDVIWGELYAKRWERVLDILNNCDDQLSYIAVRGFVKKRIQSEYNRAEDERMRNFIRPNRR
jgi:hypothetical protein